MRERFDSEYIRSELERLGDQLEAPLTVYLIGGGSMAFRDLKETTKDIDLVVTDLWVLAGDRADQHRANELAKELGQERFDGDRYEFQILVETPESARSHGDRLQDVFADAITLVDSDALRNLKHELMSDA